MPTIKGSLNLVTDRPVDSISEVWVRARETRGQGDGLVVGVNDRVPVTDGLVEFTALPGPAILVLVQNGMPIETLPMLVGDEDQQSLRLVVQAAQIAGEADKRVIEQLSAEVAANAARSEQYRTEAAESASAAQASETAAAKSASNAKTSETNAKQSETNAGDFAAVATTAATESVAAMERATDLAGGDFATRDYVNQKVSSVTLVGEGFPEGKVSAPVGAVYTDSAATNGAIRWIKTSGTSTSGWKVEYADTGSRVLHNSEIPPSKATGTIRVRRVGDVVSLNIFILVLNPGYVSSETIFTIPKGFIPENRIFSYPIVNRNFIENHQTLDIDGFGNVSIIGKPTGRLYFEMSWLTKDNWPTSLPGTPA